MLSRRGFIAGGVGAGAAGAAVSAGVGLNLGQSKVEGLSQEQAAEQPPPRMTVSPFTVPLALPATAQPTRRTTDADHYEMSMQPGTCEIVPGLKTPVLSYGGSFLGPTVMAKRGRPVSVTYQNRLDSDKVVHLHGGHVPSASDGFPTDVISPGSTRTNHYPNSQQGATLWYHDHSHHHEAENVYRGLHGFYLLSDEEEEREFALPQGNYDLPIMLTDVLLDVAGEMLWQNPGWDDRVTLLTNGVPAPFHHVEARKYRLRLLNAATHRVFNVSFGGHEFFYIGSDGGYVENPIAVTELNLSPGERADVVVDFRPLNIGESLILEDATGPLCRFDVVWRPEQDPSRLPSKLRDATPQPRATQHREFVLMTDQVTMAPYINGRLYDPERVDIRVREGSTEIWTIRNEDTVGGMQMMHNFHPHLAQFQIVDRNGRKPTAVESGWKDTVGVAPGEQVRIKLTLGGHTGRFVYHCHVLEHAEFMMMGNMLVE